jgi:hypothetical protein
MSHTLILKNVTRDASGKIIHGDIETSGGVTVALNKALQLFPHIRRAREQGHTTFNAERDAKAIADAIEAEKEPRQ